MNYKDKMHNITKEDYMLYSKRYNRAIELASKWFEKIGFDCYVSQYIKWLTPREVDKITEIRFYNNKTDKTDTDCTVMLNTFKSEDFIPTGGHNPFDGEAHGYDIKGKFKTQNIDFIHSNIFFEEDEAKRIEMVIELTKKKMIKESKEKIENAKYNIQRSKKEIQDNVDKIENINKIRVDII